ncbi:alanine/glycine:cation symporter family protein [Acinetobacter rudis]|uniref:Alanine/glycine:cation symporter family protein n=1 Tax=Acinetobacter rudis TaxID=632955 RepID=A0AAW8J5Q3_9GAMM|nr:alanine/glycine:cation symporter family protein [Acinetobacter rudis]MDQ8934412.1 alanine/glycine:cation symporter family protein [Acinetobacter rudis]MDQ8951893.1 alanine/glycine:cation symporter family protein [Acinetobacter rudis]MDQ9016688.1 alanine/glycine:cation symporter family protein [Acinetobacter rudis]
MNESISTFFLSMIDRVNQPLWDLLVIFLLAVGIFYTISTKAVQVRFFFHSFKIMKNSRNKKDDHGLTPFQAFVTGLASRVGVGNIAGVAIAIAIGGPGAVFWMWVTALLGMSSAFIESTLAQLFKVRDSNTKQFRGGPAYYITQGLKNKTFGIVFALSLIFTYGFVFNSVQINAIVSASSHSWGWDKANIILPLGGIDLVISWVGLALVVLVAIAIFGGIKRIARFAEMFVPLKAGLYLLIALYIILSNYAIIPDIIKLIFTSAFEFKAAAGGFFGSMISITLLQGIKRGLFSNEAGMGSAPNAAAASDVKHPVNQGLVQMLGVFVDTFIVCTSTAMIILVSGVYHDAGFIGVELTQRALESQIGMWGGDLLAILLFLFCYSAVLGNYAYAESNVQFINNNPKLMLIFRICVLVMVYFGAISSVPLVWNMADMFMGIMAVINLTAILLLTPMARTLLKDYTSQLKRGVKEPEFKIDQYPELKKKVSGDIWSDKKN